MPYNDKNTDSDLRLMVRYPDQPQATGYAAEELGALDLAYASTIHKSQGSEYPVVVLMITPATSHMLNRNLLYTAVTRARELCLIIGTRKALDLAVRKVSTEIRQTRLADRLRGTNENDNENENV